MLKVLSLLSLSFFLHLFPSQAVPNVPDNTVKNVIKVIITREGSIRLGAMLPKSSGSEVTIQDINRGKLATKLALEQLLAGNITLGDEQPSLYQYFYLDETDKLHSEEFVDSSKKYYTLYQDDLKELAAKKREAALANESANAKK